MKAKELNGIYAAGKPLFDAAYGSGSSKKGRRAVSQTPVEVSEGEGTSASSAHDVGDEVRYLRKTRDMTLQDVAALTGFSIGYLSQVERGVSSPSVDAMRKIAQALGTSIGWFFHNEESGQLDEQNYVVRARRRRSVKYDAGVKDELLSPHLKGQLEMLLCRFPVGTSSGPEMYNHEGEECGYVLEGRLKVEVDGRHFVLEAGDSFGFASTLPHRFVNVGKEEVVIVFASTPPSF